MSDKKLSQCRGKSDGSGRARGAAPMRAQLEILEGRVLYSADPLAMFSDSVGDTSDELFDQPLPRAPDSTMASSMPVPIEVPVPDSSMPVPIADSPVPVPVELVFINPDVDGRDVLLADLQAQAVGGRALEVIVLDGALSGIDQIGEVLGRYPLVDHVHVISHGSSDGIQLGATWLDGEALDQHRDQLAGWRGSLAGDSSWMFYGCDLAAEINGRTLLGSFSDLTGSRVAASIDATGHHSLQADWDLEFQTAEWVGDAVYESLLSEVAQAGWVGALAADFAATDDDLGAVLSGDDLNFTASLLTSNDTPSGSDSPVILSTTTPTLGSLAVGDGDFTYTAAAGSTGVDSFDYHAMSGSPDLISQWRLTTDGADDANRNNGTVTTDGPSGALMFDGDDYVEVPNFTYPTDFTLTLDFRVNDLNSGNEEVLFSQGIWRQPNFLSVWIAGEQLSYGPSLLVEMNDSTESGTQNTSFVFDVSAFEDDGNWHNFAIVVQQGVGHSIYIDGNLEFTSSRADGPFTPAGPAHFGVEATDSGFDYHLMNHEVSNARLYDGFDLATIQANALNEFDRATASVTVRNEEMLVTNNTIEVTEDQSVTITNSHLLTTDIEDGPAAITYELLTDVSYGQLWRGGTALSAGDTFTQLDINSGELSFRHGGDEYATGDSLSLRVDDGAGSHTDFVFNIDLKSVNDAPLMADTALAAVDEDGVDPVGESVSQIFGAVYSDVDGSLSGIAIVADASSTEGGWQYSTDAGSSWYDVGAVDVTSALAIDAATQLRFLPAPDYFGAVPGLSLHGIDDTYGGAYTSGSFTEHTSLSATGGSTPFTAVASTLTTTVLADGPTDLSAGITINTDGGNDSYLLADNGAALLGGLTQVSVEVQFAIDTVNAQNTLISYTDSVGDIFKVIVRREGEVGVTLFGTDVTSVEIPELVDGEKHTVTVTWDADDGYLRMFADGRLIHVETGFYAGQSLRPGGTLVLGMEQDAPNDSFEAGEVLSGTLYDVRLWNEARTHAEIDRHHDQKLYHNDLPSSLIANWQMAGVNSNGELLDVVSGAALSIEHYAAAGFTTSSPATQLQVAEDATAGTVVGSVVPSMPYRGEDLVQDGAFIAPDENLATLLETGQSIGAHWQVDQGNVEILPADVSSPLGGAVVALTGTSMGTISQVVATEAGKTYQLRFALTGDFDGSATPHGVRVTTDTGVLLHTSEFSVEAPHGWSDSNILWEHRALSFTADSDNTTLSFESLTNLSGDGPMISDIQLVEQPSAIAELLAANPSLVYDAGTDKFYQPETSRTDWESARNNAIASKLNGVSGRLVTIHSAYENSVVQSIAQSIDDDVFIGATDQTTEGQWFWQNGTTDESLFWSGKTDGSAPDGAYSNWRSTEPNNFGVHSDVAVLDKGHGQWKDVVPNNQHESIIEWDAGDVLSNFSYSIEADPENAFSIDEWTGELSVANLSGIDHTTNPDYDITVRATDVSGEYVDKVVRVWVTDNTAPQLTNIESVAGVYVENDTVAITSTLLVSDVDDTDLASATISVAGFVAGQDQLSFADYGPFTGDWNAATGTLTVTGVAPVAEWQNALRTVQYTNVSDHPAAATITIDFVVSDGFELSNSVQRQFTVQPVNDAPTQLDSTLVSVRENDTDAVGQSIHTIFNAQFSDVDGSLAGVGIVNDASSGEGAWQFSADNGVSWHSIGVVSEAAAVMLLSDNLLRFVPGSDYYGPVPALSVVAMDDSFDNSEWTTDGIRIFADVSVRGLASPYSANTAVLDSMVLADGPTTLSTGIQLNNDGGNDAYLIADDATGLIGGLEAITVEAQVMFTTPVGGKTPLFSYAVPSFHNTLLLAIEDDGSVFIFVGNTRVDVPASYRIPADNQLHAIAFSWESQQGVVAVYIDGQMVHREAGVHTGAQLSGGGELVIGQEQDAVDGGYQSTESFSGTYHDLRIWNEARSEAEIAQTYRHKFHTDALPSTLIANWQMEGFDAGARVLDVVAGHTLNVSHTTGSGFTGGNAEVPLSVVEYADNGTVVGTVVPHAGLIVEDLVADGSFTHAGATAFTHYTTGQTLGADGPWVVTSGDVNLSGSWEPSPLGGTALDLNGLSPGAVSQTLSTQVGETYQVSFAFSGNFDALTDKHLEVSAGGSSQTYTVSPPQGWVNTTNLMWQQRYFLFTATSTSTTLTFSSLAPSDRYGPMISDVQVVKMPAFIADSVLSDPSLTYNGEKIFKTVSPLMTFDDAQNVAVTERINGVPGQLVTIDSAHENEVVHGLAQSIGQNVWLGASDAEEEGQWHWLQGTEQSAQFWQGTASGDRVAGAYANWMVGEPNNVNDGGEHYSQLYQSNGAWNDLPEDFYNATIIEWDTDEVLSSYTYRLLADSSSAFSIDETTGVISVSDGSLLDHEDNVAHEINVEVTDVRGETVVETVTIYVVDANAPQLLDSATAALSYTENSAPLLFADGVSVIDSDDTHLQSATFVINTNYQLTEDRLTFTDTANLNGNFDVVTGTLTITGSDTVSAWQGALRSVGYQNTSENPTAGLREVEFFIHDENESSNRITTEFSVVAVNDSPAIADSRLSTTAEDSTAHTGDLIGDLLSLTATDIDGSVVSIAIAADATTADATTADATTADATTDQGLWQYSTDNGGSWYETGPVHETSALVLDTNARLRFLPSADYHGDVPGLTVYANDDTSAGATAGVSRVDIDVTSRGGSTSLSADSAVIDGIVTQVNDVPNLTVTPFTVLRGGDYTLNVTNIEAVDVDVDKTLLDIIISDVPTYGQLYLSGVLLGVGDSFSQAQVEAGALEYRHSGANTLDDTVTLVFNDAGDSASAISVVRTVTVSVTETHPQAVSDVQMVDEHQAVSIAVLDNDRAADQSLDPASVTVVTAPAYGTAFVGANGVISYIHDGSETTGDSLTYTVSDMGGDASAPAAVTLTINPINDPPVIDRLIDPAPQGDEDTTVEISAFELATWLVHSDAEDGTLGQFTVETLHTGSLLIGTDKESATRYEVGVNDLIGDNKNAYWKPDANVNGLQRAFSVFGRDSSGELTAQSVDVNFDIMPHNDIPVVSDLPDTPLPYIHRSAAITLAPLAVIDDIDSAMLSGMTVQVVGVEPGVDHLSIDGGALAVDWNSTDGTLTLSGVAGVADYTDALRTLAYESRAMPVGGELTTRRMEVTVTDNVGGESAIDAVEVKLQVPPVPIQINNAAIEASVFTEGSDPLAIFDELEIQSVDGRDLTRAVIKVDNYRVSEDVLRYSDSADINGEWNATSGTMTLIGEAPAEVWQQALRGVGYQNVSDNPVTESRVLSVSLSSSSGESNALSVPVNIVSVNDAPQVLGASVPLVFNTPHVFTTADFGFSDPAEGDGFLAVRIVNVPVDGQLLWRDTPVNIDQEVLVSDINEGALRYVPASNVESVTRIVQYQVRDTGGVLNGGSDLSAQSATLALTIAADQVPQAQTDRATVAEGGMISSLSDGESRLTANDIDPDTDDRELLVELVGEPLHGTLQLHRDGTFTYVHDGSETRSDSFSYRVVDNVSELGSLLGSVGLVEIAITPMNDVPQASQAIDQVVVANEPVHIELPPDLFTDLDVDDQLLITANLADGSPLPSWLAFDRETGQFNGQPDNTQTGTLKIVVTATDAAGASASSEFALHIEPQIGAAFSQAVASTTAVSSPVIEEVPEPELRVPESTSPVRSVETTEDEPGAEPSEPQVAVDFLFRPDQPPENIELTFEDTVIKHGRIRTATTLDVVALDNLIAGTASPVNLQQLFFMQSDNPLQSSRAIQQELSRISDDLTASTLQYNVAVGGTVSLTAGLSLGYVIWLVRGGLLLSSVLTSMPAWKLIDPVPVLEEMVEKDEGDSESLESMVDEDSPVDDRSADDDPSADDHKAAHEDRQRADRPPLRSHGD